MFEVRKSLNSNELSFEMAVADCFSFQLFILVFRSKHQTVISVNVGFI